MSPIVAASERPRDISSSVLVEAEMTDEDGETHHLSDTEITRSRTCSCGLRHHVEADGRPRALLARPELLDALRRSDLLRGDRGVGAAPTDPMFSASRGATSTYGVGSPGARCTLSRCGQPTRRWDRPGAYDPMRAQHPTLGFGGGAHVCLGIHVAGPR